MFVDRQSIDETARRASQWFTPLVMRRKREKFSVTNPDGPENVFCWRRGANYAPEIRPILRDDIPASTPDTHETMANTEASSDICHPHRSDHDARGTDAP